MKKQIFSAILLFVFAIAAQAQNITVHGTVLSKTDDEPLIGASIISDVKGSMGAATDFDGNFTMTVPEGSYITVSYVGYTTMKAAAQPTMTIYLEEDAELLDEVVVVGYSSEKKSDLTGSVSVVKMKDVADTPTGNVIIPAGTCSGHEYHYRRYSRWPEHRHIYTWRLVIPKRCQRTALCNRRCDDP